MATHRPPAGTVAYLHVTEPGGGQSRLQIDPPQPFWHVLVLPGQGLSAGQHRAAAYYANPPPVSRSRRS